MGALSELLTNDYTKKNEEEDEYGFFINEESIGYDEGNSWETISVRDGNIRYASGGGA